MVLYIVAYFILGVIRVEHLKDKVKKQLDEEEERKDILSKHLNKRNERPLKEKEVYLDRMVYVNTIVDEFKRLIKRIEEEPSLVYTDVKSVIEPERLLVYEMLGNELKRDLQTFLASKADVRLKKWINEKGENWDYTVRVREGGSFPTILAVYDGDYEVMQLSVVHQWYGKREKVRDEEELEDEYNIEYERLKDEYESKKKELQRNEARRDNPLNYYKGFKNRVVYYFIDKEKLNKDLEKLVKESERKLEISLLNKERYKRNNYKHKMVRNEKLRKAYERLEPFFKELGYKEETLKNKLF